MILQFIAIKGVLASDVTDYRISSQSIYARIINIYIDSNIKFKSV